MCSSIVNNTVVLPFSAKNKDTWKVYLTCSSTVPTLLVSSILYRFLYGKDWICESADSQCMCDLIPCCQWRISAIVIRFSCSNHVLASGRDTYDWTYRVWRQSRAGQILWCNDQYSAGNCWNRGGQDGPPN